MRRRCFLILFVLGCSRGPSVEEISLDPSVELEPATEFVADTADWPRWRGPHGNGVSASASAPTEWSETKHVIWKAEVPGRGHSSPVVHGQQVILGTALEEQQQQLVVAFDRATGSENWRTVVHEGGFPTRRQMHAKGTHANGTVACDDQSIFTAFLNNDTITASALDFEGEVVWQTELGPFSSKFGYAPSPVLYKSLVIFAADNFGGGYLAAVHRKTGKLVWRKARSRSSSYSSPVVAHVAGRDQLLISGGYEVCSYDPSNGELIWSCEGTTDATCGTMVWNDDLVFASGGYPDKQTLAVRADGSAEVVWTNYINNYEPSMVFAEGFLFSVNDNGIAYCWEGSTGKLRWKKRLQGSFSSSPVVCNGLIYASNLSGATFVYRANGEKYEPVAKNQLGSDIFASPAICGGQVYLRVGTRQGESRQEVLFCLGESS